MPGYKAQYETFYNGYDLGVSTKIAEILPSKNYKITYKLSIHKFFVSKEINRTSTGIIDNFGFVQPTVFEVKDSDKKLTKKFSDLSNISKKQTKRELDWLSYITQIRISLIKGKLITNFKEQTLKNDLTVHLSELKTEKEVINGKTINVTKISYKALDGNNTFAHGEFWLDKDNMYIPLITNIESKKNRGSNKYIKAKETLIKYTPNVKKYGCLLYNYQINKTD